MKEQTWGQGVLIVESLTNGISPVLLDNEDLVLGYASGKIRICFIRILLRDRVKMEVSRYDLTKENVIYRLHNNNSND